MNPWLFVVLKILFHIPVLYLWLMPQIASFHLLLGRILFWWAFLDAISLNRPFAILSKKEAQLWHQFQGNYLSWQNETFDSRHWPNYHKNQKKVPSFHIYWVMGTSFGTLPKVIKERGEGSHDFPQNVQDKLNKNEWNIYNYSGKHW